MRPLSATECITPAIDRTKLVLFAPFRKGRTWKLSATAYLCRIGTMFFPFPIVYLLFIPSASRRAGTVGVIALVVFILLVTALYFFLFHVCSRLQFAYFDILVNRGQFVAPAWRKYPHTLPWTALKVVVGTGAILACSVPIAAYFHHILPLLRAMQSVRPGQPPPPQFMAVLFAGYGLFFLIFGPLFLASSLLSDFIVPSLALEDTTLATAFRRLGQLIRQEPGEFALYTLLKVVLAIALYIGIMIALEFVLILLTLIVGLVIVLLGFALHLAGVPTVVLTGLAIVLGILWYVFITVYAALLALGPVFTFLDAYALYFLGGRYPLLGDLLDRSTPPPAFYPAPYPTPPPPLSLS